MKVLIVFYSRTGNTRRAGEAVAEELRAAGCEVAAEELVDRKNRRGLRVWSAGIKDATLKHTTEIEPVGADVAAFDVVVAGTPLWAGTVVPAVRTFLNAYRNEIRQVAFFCTMLGLPDNRSFGAMTKVCGREPVARMALIDHHIIRNDPDKFLSRTSRFARTIAEAGGSDKSDQEQSAPAS